MVATVRTTAKRRRRLLKLRLALVAPLGDGRAGLLDGLRLPRRRRRRVPRGRPPHVQPAPAPRLPARRTRRHDRSDRDLRLVARRRALADRPLARRRPPPLAGGARPLAGGLLVRREPLADLRRLAWPRLADGLRPRRAPRPAARPGLAALVGSRRRGDRPSRLRATGSDLWRSEAGRGGRRAPARRRGRPDPRSDRSRFPASSRSATGRAGRSSGGSSRSHRALDPAPALLGSGRVAAVASRGGGGGRLVRARRRRDRVDVVSPADRPAPRRRPGPDLHVRDADRARP